MATTTYSFGPAGGVDIVMNDVATLGNQSQPAIAGNPAGTSYFGAWTHPGLLSDSVDGRVINSDHTPVASEFTINSTTLDNQNDVSLAGLANGRYVAAFTDYSVDPGGDIRARLFNADGTPVAADFAVGTLNHERQPDVAVLADGGFVVSWTAGGPGDVLYARAYNADGTPHAFPIWVNGNPNVMSHTSVAGLAGGGFVVAWEESPAGGSDTEVRFRRFNENGTALDGTNSVGVLIDTAGSINRDIQVAGLPDGGFVVAYEDNGWGSGSDITARVFNADGTGRSPFLQVNSAANIGVSAGTQDKPTLTVLPNGYFVVGWVNNNIEFFQAYDAAGHALGTNTAVALDVVENEIAALSGSVIANVWRSTVTDGSGDSIHTSLKEFGRIITGNGGNETIIGVGDAIWETLRGSGGDDVLEGRAGHDTLDGGTGFDYASYSLAPGGVTASLANPAINTGDAASDTYTSIEGLIGSAFNDTLAGNNANNTLIGGAGDDTVVFSQSLDKYLMQEFGDLIFVAGAEGSDILIGIEHLQFTDGTINVVDDGNALFDTLYYLSHNVDVFHAGVNALDHFNTNGWHEGRDPNALFDTSGYLAVNKDIAAAGINPLDHYHQSGWHEGRDPSAAFDTTLYLIRNPDVAAAGIDPLAHFLQFGFSEGRSAYAAVGPTVGGFDAQYYLFHNPDVAAAGVDPLAHFNSFGWHEGRNPNAYFDTAGYLSHYADVAAAGINPLQHYETYGWHEGRDPSAGFDTLGYLAANPDVAAAQVNPLDHFLANGIYEGRQAVNDGLWH